MSVSSIKDRSHDIGFHMSKSSLFFVDEIELELSVKKYLIGLDNTYNPRNHYRFSESECGAYSKHVHNRLFLDIVGKRPIRSFMRDLQSGIGEGMLYATRPLLELFCIEGLISAGHYYIQKKD